MISSLATAAVALLVFFAIATWGYLIVRVWAPAARRRGGRWFLEAQLFTMGPLLMVCIFFYGPDGPVQPWSTIARVLTLVSIGLAVLTFATALRTPRKGVGAYLTVMAVYYAGLVVSAFAGATSNLPEHYWTTPLIVISFLVHGGYTRDWLFSTSRWLLRTILVLSFLALAAPAGMAFNTVESRTVFGIARFEGITEHPNTLAMFASIALLIELFRKTRSKLWLIIAAAALVLAQSNTAWLALAVALVFLSGRLGVVYRWCFGIASVGVAIALLVSTGFARWVGSFVFGASTLNGRTTIWEAALSGFKQYPLFGYGPTLLDEQYRHAYLGTFAAAAQAHNQWVQSLASTGIVGLTSLVVMLGVFFTGSLSVSRGHTYLPAALMTALIVRCVTETPLRPTGPSETTFLVLIVLASVTVSIVPTITTPRRNDLGTRESISGQSAAVPASGSEHWGRSRPITSM